MEILNYNLAADVAGRVRASLGLQRKYLIDGKWYKADEMGCEGAVEFLVSRMLEHSTVPFTEYDLVSFKTNDTQVATGCVSRNFCGENERVVTVAEILQKETGYTLDHLYQNLYRMSLEDRIKYVVDTVERVTGLTGFGAYLTSILELDEMTLNEDRHLNNIGVIASFRESPEQGAARDKRIRGSRPVLPEVDNQMWGDFRFAPIFDNGAAFLSDTINYPLEMSVSVALRKMRFKPFSRDNKQVRVCEQLYGKQLGLSLTREQLLDAFDEIRKVYPEKVVERLRAVVNHQLKYVVPRYMTPDKDLVSDFAAWVRENIHSDADFENDMFRISVRNHGQEILYENLFVGGKAFFGGIPPAEEFDEVKHNIALYYRSLTDIHNYTPVFGTEQEMRRNF